jgi:hypothetical protein
MTLLDDLLRAILHVLTGTVGPFGMAQTIFFLAGVWALWRILPPLHAAEDDLRAVRTAPDWQADCPEEIIAAERVRNLRLRLAGAAWIALTGLLYMLPGTRWPPVTGDIPALYGRVAHRGAARCGPGHGRDGDGDGAHAGASGRGHRPAVRPAPRTGKRTGAGTRRAAYPA